MERCIEGGGCEVPRWSCREFKVWYVGGGETHIVAAPPGPVTLIDGSNPLAGHNWGFSFKGNSSTLKESYASSQKSIPMMAMTWVSKQMAMPLVSVQLNTMMSTVQTCCGLGTSLFGSKLKKDSSMKPTKSRARVAQ